MWTMWSPASVQDNHTRLPHRNSLEPSEPCLRNLHQHAPEPSGTCLRNLHQHAPELSGTFRNPSEPSGAFRNLPPELAGTLQNLQNLPEHASETYTSARTPRNSPTLCRTLRNSPEPSGTCSCDPHRHTPELIWAEDPTSFRCWGNIVRLRPQLKCIPDLLPCGFEDQGPLHQQTFHVEVRLPGRICSLRIKGGRH